MFKNLVLTTFILNSLINLAYADFKPKESPPPKSTAQGTRGCPNRLGDLALFGGAKQEGQLILDINVEHPLLLYQVISERPEKVLLTITRVDGKFDCAQIYERESIVTTLDYSILSLPKLEPNKKYLMTLMLLCQDRPQYGKTIQAWLDIVPYQTQVNRFVQSRKIAEISQNTP